MSDLLNILNKILTDGGYVRVDKTTGQPLTKRQYLNTRIDALETSIRDTFFQDNAGDNISSLITKQKTALNADYIKLNESIHTTKFALGKVNMDFTKDCDSKGKLVYDPDRLAKVFALRVLEDLEVVKMSNKKKRSFTKLLMYANFVKDPYNKLFADLEGLRSSTAKLNSSSENAIPPAAPTISKFRT